MQFLILPPDPTSSYASIDRCVWNRCVCNTGVSETRVKEQVMVQETVENVAERPADLQTAATNTPPPQPEPGDVTDTWYCRLQTIPLVWRNEEWDSAQRVETSITVTNFFVWLLVGT